MHKKQLNQTCDQAITRYSQGDKEALSVIYDCMARMVFSVAYAIVGNYEDAEDVLQDTMIEIMKYAHTFQPGTNAKAWILTMTRHLAVDIVRKRKPSIPYDDWVAQSPDDDDQAFETDDAINRDLETSINHDSTPEIEDGLPDVSEMLGILNEEDRQILILRLYSGLSYKDISKMMGLTVSVAQKRYQRAIKKIKQRYR